MLRQVASLLPQAGSINSRFYISDPFSCPSYICTAKRTQALTHPVPTGVLQLTVVGCDDLRAADIGGEFASEIVTYMWLGWL